MAHMIWRAAVTVPAALGVPVSVACMAVGWPADNPMGFVIAPAILAVMTLSGISILLLAGGLDQGGWALRAAMLTLGLSTLAYPCLMALAAAGIGGGGVLFAAGIGHWIPLTMVNLLPILAISTVTRRSRRAGIGLLLLLATVAVLVPALGEESLALLGSAAWLGGFAIPVLASWPLVRGTGAETRRRAIICGLASVVPVVIIGFCMMLGAAEMALDIAGLGVSALMVGFSLCAAGTALLVRAATRRAPSWLLRRRIILASLAVLLALVTLIAGIGVGLAVLASSGSAAALPAAVLTTAVVGLGSALLHRWAARQIDPRDELESELAALGDASGHRQLALQQVLRKVTGDPGLQLVVRAGDGAWLDADGRQVTPAADAVVLDGSEGRALAGCTTARARHRLAGLGDCSRLSAAAVLETSIEREAARADGAAIAERQRLSRDLHDGVQAHLLGIALNLQLSGQLLSDPGARILVGETVGAMRQVVDQIRALGAGRVPATLASEGLGAALAQLVEPLDGVCQQGELHRRHPVEVETTAYFVACEAVANAVKHSGAQRIALTVEESRDALILTVSDDGSGGADLRLGAGLRGITERVAACGGLLTVRDGTPRGTVVEASLPSGMP